MMQREQAKQLYEPVTVGQSSTDSSELQKEISAKLLWHQNVLKPASLRYIRTMAAVSKDKVAAHIKDEIFEIILPILNRELAQGAFVCGGDCMTIADIRYYQEIQ